MAAVRIQGNITMYGNLNNVYREVMLISLIHGEVKTEAAPYSLGAFPRTHIFPDLSHTKLYCLLFSRRMQLSPSSHF